MGGWPDGESFLGCDDIGKRHKWEPWGMNFGIHPSNETRYCEICHAAQSRGQTELTKQWWGER